MRQEASLYVILYDKLRMLSAVLDESSVQLCGMFGLWKTLPTIQPPPRILGMPPWRMFEFAAPGTQNLFLELPVR